MEVNWDTIYKKIMKLFFPYIKYVPHTAKNKTPAYYRQVFCFLFQSVKSTAMFFIFPTSLLHFYTTIVLSRQHP